MKKTVLNSVKILSIFIMSIILFSCSDAQQYNIEKNVQSVEDNDYKTRPRNRIKDGYVYFARENYSEEKKMKINYFPTLEESLKNVGMNGDSLYKGQKVDEIIYEFKYDNGAMEVFFLSDCYKKDEKCLFHDVLHENEKGEYSDILNAWTPSVIKGEFTNLFAKLIQSEVTMTGLPIEKLPNRFFGITTEKSVYSLKIEGQKPDKIIKFNVNNMEYYFWVYKDLKTKPDKSVDKYVIEYDGKKD